MRPEAACGALKSALASRGPHTAETEHARRQLRGDEHVRFRRIEQIAERRIDEIGGVIARPVGGNGLEGRVLVGKFIDGIGRRQSVMAWR